MKIILSLFVFGTLLSGCAAWNQPNSHYGGYSETKIGENIFQVSFQEDGYIHKDGESDFALLYSAEVSTRNGFRYFILVESKEDSSAVGKTFVTTKPSKTNTIICFKEKPNNFGLVYDAEFITKSLRLKY